MAITTSAGREADTAAPPASQADVEAAQARDSGGEAEEIDVSVRSEADTGDSIGASTRDARKVVIDEGGEGDGSELASAPSQEEKQPNGEQEAPPSEPDEQPPTEEGEEQPQAASGQDQLNEAWNQFGEEVRKFRQERREWERDKQAVTGLDDVQKLAKENPLAALQKLGVDQDSLIGALAEAQNPDNKTGALEKQVETLTKWKQESEIARQQSEINRQNEEIKDMAMDIAKSGGDKYELVNTIPAARDLVWDVINQYFDETGEAPKLESAVAHVEKYLEQQADMYAGTKKYGGKQRHSKPKPPPNGQTAKPRTLSSDLNAGAPPPSDKPLPMDPDQRLAEIKRRNGWW